MVFVNLLIKPFWVFGIDRTVQNSLGGSDYGLYFAIFNFTYLFQIVLDFGLQNYNNREVASDNSRINQLLPAILTFKTILFILYLALCVCVAYPLGYLSKPFIWVILANQILLSFNIYLRTNISAHQLFVKDALLSVLDKLLMIIFAAILIWGNLPGFQLSVFNFALVQLAAYLFTFFVCLIFSLKLTHKIYFSFDLKQMWGIARETLPYAVIHFLMTVYYRIDGVMLEQLQGVKGAEESGIYAQGYRIMESLNNIGYLLATILLPLFAFRISKQEEIKSLLKSGISIMFCVAVSIIICLFSYRFELMHLLYSSSDANYSGEVFGYLLLNFFPVAILYVIGTLLTANRNFKLMIYTLSIAVLINVLLNYYLIPVLGAKGAGLATLVTQLFMLIAYSIYVVYIFKISLQVTFLLRVLLFSALCYLMLLLVSRFAFFGNGSQDLLMHFAAYFVAIPLFAYISGLIDEKTFQLKVGQNK